MVEEMFELVNEKDEVIGRVSRKDAHRELLRHRAVHVFLFNENGELFVQQRSASKDTHPLRFGSSMGGHVDIGETYRQAAVRELKEELGITAEENELQELHMFDPVDYNWMEFAVLYSLHYKKKRHGEICLSKEECKSGAFRVVKEIEQSIRNDPSRWTPDFVAYFKWWRKQL
ncbi:NUDIX domain-containing protein [Candidatus Micrarchaeota archaeon]|nr:NUDIX domain-containing protein [Candidatus Micrarchaeota archaeon]